MKRISLFFLLGLFLTSLSYRQAEGPPLITYKKEIKKERSLASEESSQCMRDLFTTQTLKGEVKELETLMDTNRLIGRWKHLDLSELPTSAAVFLTKFGDKLGDKTTSESIDASSCQDIPCLFNTLYGTPDGIAGYVHYLWFLRTGIYLAADNVVPDQQIQTPGIYNGKSHPLVSYLLDDDELYGFWRLSKLLKAPYSTLTYLKEIQRVPRGEAMEGQNSGTCGLAHSDGWITVSDSCLTVYPRSDGGYLFPAVIHELSHQLDYEEGRRLNDDFYRSHMSDYRQMTGFEMMEYLDSNGLNIRKWLLKPDSRLVSDYAKTSPQESFAELLAYYVVDGDEVKAKVDQAALNFAAGYFQGKNFEVQNQADGWATQAGILKTNDVLKAMVSCSSPECLDQSLSLLTREELGRIRSLEPDGCRVLTNPLIAQTLPGKIRDALNETTAKLKFSGSENPEIKQKLLDNFDLVLNPEDAYTSYFICHGQNTECYPSEVASRKGPKLDEYGEAKGALLALYLETYRFERVQDEVISFYKSLLSSREGVMKIKADELWESCKQIPPSDSTPPTGNDYVVRDGYMVSSFYYCLNLGFNSGVNATLDAVKLREFTPKNREERSFVIHLLKPKFTETLDYKLQNGRKYELRYREAFITQRGTWLYNQMRSNRYWVPRGRRTQSELELACKQAAIKLIGGNIFFHLKKELYEDLLKKTCQGIH